MYNYDPSDAALPTLIKAPNFNATLHGLIHPHSSRLMALSRVQDTVVHLSQTAGQYLPSINKSAFGRGPLMTKFVGWCWEWKFDTETRKFVHSPAPQDYELHYWMRINAEKAAVLDTIYSWVNTTRGMYQTDLTLQTKVREIKTNEAKSFLSNEKQEFPYLKQYAEECGIDMIESANRILMQTKDLEKVLLETERVRLKYGKALREATTVASVRALYFDFFAEKGDPSQTMLF